MKRSLSYCARTVLSVAAAFATIGAAHADDDIHVFRLHDIAAGIEDAELRAQATEIEAIYADLERVSGVEATLLYSTSSDINAFATLSGDEKVVVVEAGFVDYAKDDRDAIAAALGHELGHHKADHIQAGRRKQKSVRVLGAILGAVVGAKVGGGNAAVSDVVGDVFDAGAGLVALKFNRNQELEADRLSVDWLIQAGYNPQGMLRLQQLLAGIEKQHPQATILSTHPTSAKRYEAAEKLIASRAPPSNLLQKTQSPLVGEQDIAIAAAAIRHDDDARIAEVLKPLEAPAAALLDSGQGMDLASYAVLDSELEWAGDGDKSASLTRRKLTSAQWKRLVEIFQARIAAHPELLDYYDAHYFRAAQGRFGAYGKDLADSLEKGQNLALDPPLPLAEFIGLAAEMRQAYGTRKTGVTMNQMDALKRYGFSHYDFLVIEAWWLRKAHIAEIDGDYSIMAALAGVTGDDASQNADAAAEAGVHIGQNVQVGANVRIGGQPAAETAKNH